MITEDDFVNALNDTWNKVRIDVSIARPTWENKRDEVNSMLSVYAPHIAGQFFALPEAEQNRLFRLAFEETSSVEY